MGRRLLVLLTFFFFLFVAAFHVSLSATDPRDAAALRSLKEIWRNLPPSWTQSDDPCGLPWEGVTCKNSRISALGLSSMGLKGKLSGDIGGLTELRSLDLSYNRDLVGPLTPRLGDLQKLNILILVGCGFSGGIPDELGKLSELSFLALNSNNLTGRIPPSLGNLSKLYWLDLADNQLTGNVPVSTPDTPGLDLLLKAKHFHFNKNQLSGPIPPRLFSPEMVLIHVLFDGNQLNGSIPDTLGLVVTIEVLRLDRNALVGRIPSNLNKLLNINELNLAHNRLTGPLPNLTGMNNLNYVDLSSNFFEPSEAPTWFSTLPSLTTLVMEHGSLQGPLPPKIFSFPQIQQVLLNDNAFNGTLSMGDSISPQLQLVDLQNNQISSVTLTAGYTNTLILVGNPVCTALSNTNYCQLQREQSSKSYSTSLANCGTKLCTADQKLSPQSCDCAYPYEGTLYFRGPSFRDLTDVNTFHALEMSLWVKLGLTPGSVSLRNPIFNSDDYLQIQLALFPPASGGKYFNRSEIQRIGFDLSNQTYKPPHEFGPFYFIASPYPFPGDHGRASIGRGLVAGIASGCSVLVLCLVAAAIYAIRQKKRAEKAIVFSKPFAASRKDSSGGAGAPQLKGARWFSYEELKKCTSNFSGSNELGSGGYGKVYRGMLSDGQIVAVKRARQGSLQGGQEFKTEIELLSRVHHKNLLALIGFCFEQGEQMLVYEFMPNGSLKESLTGKSGIHLDWRRRLRIALGSARGLAYLHELANPPIIHRDIKSTNILLDQNLSAKVADFGLSRLVCDSTKGHVSTQVKGTLGYLDPEYYMTQQLTEKSDVYSFGVVVLELVTARQPIEKGKYIVRQVRAKMTLEAEEEEEEDYCGLKDMIDPSIIAEVGTAGTSLRRVLELAMQCVEESAGDRPTMSQAVKTIEEILQEEGVNGNSTSASSSATDFGIHCLRGGGGGGGANLRQHPYCGGSGEVCTSYTKSNSSGGGKGNCKEKCDAFDYSGGYAVSTTVEPK
ncbi:unnamed protein product [Linum tenue]|uniref:non-specific serine/threonine protein kinase n=1 Tax=Linum tenue TaxID=586396 RepID=A0AAV0JE36_9ROSI|nr:unnamed protein product [Linum tenue]